MVETKLHFLRLGGILFFLLGLSGLMYLGWVYVVWGQTLPKFSQDELFAVKSSFGDLLTQAETTTTNILDEYQPVSEIKIEQTVPALSAQKVLSDKDFQTRLSVPALSIENALVELDVDGSDERIYDTVLTRAVGHLENSAYPGDFGNTFLFGHSKLPILAGSDYESIFTNLPKVKVGDVVRVQYEGVEYTYQINQTGVVDPDDVFIMNQPKTKKMLTLMTCIPPGFDSQRYITVGELVEVKPHQ